MQVARDALPLLPGSDLVGAREELGLLDGQGGQARQEARDNGGRIKAVREVGIDRGQQYGPRLVHVEGSRHWQFP